MTQEDSYAAALRRMLEKGSTPKAAVASLKTLLERRGRTALFPRISRAFKRLTERERMRNSLILAVSGIDQARAKKEAKEILAALHVDAGDVEGSTEENLIGVQGIS